MRTQRTQLSVSARGECAGGVAWVGEADLVRRGKLVADRALDDEVRRDGHDVRHVEPHRSTARVNGECTAMREPRVTAVAVDDWQVASVLPTQPAGSHCQTTLNAGPEADGGGARCRPVPS